MQHKRMRHFTVKFLDENFLSELSDSEHAEISDNECSGNENSNNERSGNESSDNETSGIKSSGDANEELHDVDITDNAPPRFFNSSNSRQVLLLLKSRIYFNGTLKIQLLAGQVSIFGYAMQQNETVTAYSPRGHSFLYLSPSPQNNNDHIETTEDVKNLKMHLKELSEIFLSTDQKTILSNFNSSTDAVVLLENGVNKSVFMIENCMKETVFPTFNTFTSRRFHHTESILRTDVLLSTATGLKINEQWENIAVTSSSRHVIIGGKGVGKSTFLRYLINRNVRKFNKILLIDLDIGQPEMFLPQTVSATVITEPILGPGYLRNKSPHKSYLYGDVNVLVSSIKYLKCVLKLLQHCKSTHEFQSIPWVINTMGYNRGFGLELMVAILRSLKPTDLIQIQDVESCYNFDKILTADEVNDFQIKFFKEEVLDLDNNCSYTTHIFNAMSQKEQKKFWDITPKDLRFAMILSKLGNILEGNSRWITDVKPLR